MFTFKTVLTIVILILFNQNVFSQSNKIFDWLFIYYMPYDNNLSALGEQIKLMMIDGLVSENVAVTMQSDFTDSLGMKRFFLTKDIHQSFEIKSESSASSETYHNYLEWIQQNFSAKNYAIIFLDHSGKLDEIGLDEQPIRQFLKADSINLILQNFIEKIGKKPELFFLQVCSKANIETLYEFKDCANYSLASQDNLGAPNYYYSNVLKKISKNPMLNGKELAQIIVQNDAHEMYKSYTCVNNLQFDSLAILMNQLAETLQKEDSLIFNYYEVKYLDYAGEWLWDFNSFLKNLVLPNKILQTKKKNIIDFVNKKLVVLHSINSVYSKMDGYCGVSILGLSEFYDKYLEEYRHLSFFKDVKMKLLFQHLKKIKD